MNIQNSPYRNQVNIPENIYCLRLQDVNECALGLTNCSAVAVCIDLPIGYKCRCPEG